jgi:hypothetical protein
MRIQRIGSVVAVAIATLALYGCNASVGGNASRGTIQARVSFPPSDVASVYVTASRGGNPVAGTAMTGSGTSWTGGDLSVPPASDYQVTAYAFSGSLPQDPVHDTTGLVYRGQAVNVAVTGGQTTPVTIVLIPWPDSGPQPGVNTPPHIVFGAHPDAILDTDTVELSATAWDPDPGTSLSFRWDDTGAGGAFSGGDGQSPGGVAPGNTVSVNYTPANGFLGPVTIRLVVSDGAATVYQTFAMDVTAGNGTISPTLVFDSGPEVAITRITSQSLPPSGTSQITYQVTAGDETYTAGWSDDCGGGFDAYSSTPSAGESATVTWNAPDTAPASHGQCNLRLEVRDGAGAYTWVSLVVWVDAGQDLPFGKTVFATSDLVNGGYFNGDPARADALCQTAATRGGLPGSYHAFVSFTTVDARDRITEGPYSLPDGSRVADSKADLLDGTIQHAIDSDESRNIISSFAQEVWTGSSPDGTLYTDHGYGPSNNCNNWTTSSNADTLNVNAVAGSPGETDALWVTQFPGAWYWCGDIKHVYCFQQ